MSPRFFRNSPADAILAFAGLAQVAFLFWTLWAFPTLPVWTLIPCGVLFASMICWNLQCISHNFIHNPFFASPWLNRLFGVLETLAIGLPHQLYHHYHMNHHWGNNDRVGRDGSTRDWSSTYRHGKDGQHEAFWRYCLLSFFRVEVSPVLKVAVRHGRANVAQVVVETLALVTLWALMVWVSWPYFVFFYLPSYFFGWVLSYAEGYLEHYGAEPGNPLANSVSSYNRLYNLLWFNNGYHQEHHYNPRCHWTQMPELHEQLRPRLEASGTRILRGPHLTALIEDYFTRKKPVVIEEKRRAA